MIGNSFNLLFSHIMIRIVDKKATKIYIIMEYCEGGDLKTLLKNCKKNKEFIAEDVIWKIFSQVMLALNDCHHKKSGKILHRDLKPANIFLDEHNNIKLGDFGLSRMMSEQSVYAYTYVGTPYYMSPEQITESKYNEKSDIWSAGCLLYEIAALKPPFEASNHLSLALKIKSGKFDRIPIMYSEDLQRVIQFMLSINQNERPTAEELLKIPHVNLRVKEKRMKDKASQLKHKEKEVKKKEEELRVFEANLDQKQKELKEKELKLREMKRQAKEEEEYGTDMNSFQRLRAANELNMKYINSWERKLNEMNDEDKENDYHYKGNRPVNKRFETMQMSYKPIGFHLRNYSDNSHEMVSNFNNVRKSQGLVVIFQNETFYRY